MGNYYICKIFAMILIVLIVFTGCGQNRITEKEEKKETVESEMNAEVKKAAQTFRSVYMKEKSELNTLKAKRKIINCLEEKGYAAVVDRGSAQSIIFASPSIDISNEVLSRLGYSN